MNLIKYLFSFILILTITDVSSQSKEATISFETKFLNNQQIEFVINGQTITPDEKKHKIKIYETDFDTLISWRNGKEVSLSILKFKENTKYIIRINPCSLYDIRPLKEPIKGVVRYNFISSEEDSAKAELDFYSQKIISSKTSDYYTFIPSAMCVYGKKKIALTDIKTEKEFSSVYFNFLHGEKLTFTYDKQRQEQKLTLDGYINDIKTYSEMDTID